MEDVSTIVFGVWFLVGAALVFWMQAGFAMVEAGFTRAKNAGNIIMKNLMDFCLGTVSFMILGSSLLLGSSDWALGGFIGKPSWDLFLHFENYDWSSFVFNLVFCATAKNHRVRSYGRENKVLCILCILSYHLTADISY